MGSSCSRVGRSPSSNRYNSSSSSRPLPQVDENPDSSEVFYGDNVASVDIEDGSANFDLESPFTRSNAQSSISYESSTDEVGNFYDGNGERNVEAHNQDALLSESQQLHAYGSNSAGSQSGNLDNAGMAIFSGGSSGLVAGHDADQPMGEAPLTNSLQNINSSHSVHGLESLVTEDLPGLNSENEDIAQNNSDAVSRSLGSDPSVTLYLLGYDSSRETTPQSSQDLSSGAEVQNLGSALHIDMVSISSNSLTSNIRDLSNRESRSRGRGSFLDVFSRHNLRGHRDIPAILFAIDDADDLGVHGRLLLDINSDRQNDRTSQDWETRSNNRNGQRHSRFERSDSFHHGTDEEEWHRHLCASGLHQHGTCSCDSHFMGYDSNALVRISRIVILVEAINELLDEIHRRTMPLSVTTLSLPAPESVVNSLPRKNHKKLEMSDPLQETQQCYICLAEYEEGDEIRVLPCKHEYHMACVDKWLKEVHGICPLCRADVCPSSHSQSTSATES